MKKAIYAVLLTVFLGIFAFSSWKLFGILWEYRIGENFYEDLTQFVSVPEPEETKPENEKTSSQKENGEAQSGQTKPTEPAEPVWPKVDFDALQEINPDVVGWIYIPGTKINYPVLHGDTNDTYLYHLMTGEYNSAGSIFLDAGVPSDFTAQNNPIYGHHMKNGSMFADVSDYWSQEFYDAHPFAMLVTPEGNFYVRIFSGYVTDAWDDAWTLAFGEDSFDAWLRKLERKSYFHTDVKPTTGDRIVTLSTCTYEYDDARFVVHGVLEAEIIENESAAE